ncbi:uncharacterized protein isoform X2 [Musca autumnalis]|uniref:uncharacterized protein isoform X2 n=1 Tax=Musca autumnalis TaxID=221902 RepID=UPI003CED72C5
MVKPSSYEISCDRIKCGEVFYASPPDIVFNISCIICKDSISFDTFQEHFQKLHLDLLKTEADDDTDLIEIKKEDGKLIEEEKIAIAPEEEFISVDPLSDVGKSEIFSDDLITEEDDDKPLQYIIDRNRDYRKKKAMKDEGEDKVEEETTNIPENNHNSEENDDDDYEWPDEMDDAKAKEETKKSTPNEDLPFKCSLCPRSYAIKHSLQKHNYSAHNPNKPKRRDPNKPQHKCDECQQVFRTAAILKNHKYKHTGIFCDICQKPFRQIGTMLQHKIRHTGIKQHKCKECGREFYTDKELKSHIISHIGMPFVCELCGKRCRDKGVLTAHMRRHTGERPAKCEVCNKSFFSLYDLSIHAVGHSNERPFSCEICASRFGTKKALRVHRRIHAKKQQEAGGGGSEVEGSSNDKHLAQSQGDSAGAGSLNNNNIAFGNDVLALNEFTI